MKELTPGERRSLRARAHHLRPVVIVGDAGLTAAVIHEIDANLKSHERIKIKVHDDDRAARAGLAAAVCEAVDAAFVQQIGKVVVVFRPRPEEEPPSAPRKERPRKQPRRTKRSYQMG